MRLAYFNIWNLFDLTSLASSIFVTFKIYTSSNWFSIESLRVIAAIASSNLIFKLYDWMRLWTGTAFFIELLFRSIKEMKIFVGMLIISLFAFGTPMLMISHNWEDDSPSDTRLVSKAFWRAWLIMLGEFPVA